VFWHEPLRILKEDKSLSVSLFSFCMFGIDVAVMSDCSLNYSCVLQVWLPLQPKEDKPKNKGFLSKRIMLPFAVDIYPLGKFAT